MTGGVSVKQTSVTFSMSAHTQLSESCVNNTIYSQTADSWVVLTLRHIDQHVGVLVAQGLIYREAEARSGKQMFASQNGAWGETLNIES